ncbi:iron ABC transporter ATP-binding protein [Agromyces protaetiae]|uniref:iron ABC transporter ATP-binding protein n=1 Tax=Agromyces protaetiae TaxID=2509455 RepID=UPI0013EE2CA4|nr:iron ABC transporter ATP-binding protein [Agromyces protaetiae]
MAGGAILLAVALALTACAADTPNPAETETPGASAAPTDAPGGETIAPETTAPEETSPPFAIACDALLTPDQVYAFNPNFGTDPAYAPDAAAVTAVVELGGTACGWLNQTSGEVVEIAVATPSASALAAATSQAAMSSNPVPTYGTPPETSGFFSQSGGRGTAIVFTGRYEVVVSSAALFEPGDAQQLVASVLDNLPAA